MELEVSVKREMWRAWKYVYLEHEENNYWSRCALKEVEVSVKQKSDWTEMACN